MNTIEQHARATFAQQDQPMEPLTVPADQSPVLATPAMAYGALTLAAFMAGNTVIQFDGDEDAASASMDELRGHSGEELLAMRSQRIQG